MPFFRNSAANGFTEFPGGTNGVVLIRYVSGVTSDFGVSQGSDENASFCRTIINNSRKCILLTPSTKIGVDSFVKVCDVSVFDTVITDWD